MTTSIYVPHFAEGKNYTVKYAEILRPCNVLVTAYTQCADNVMREHKYSLRCTTSIAAFNDYTPAVDLSDWTFKSLNADDHIVKIFLQYENGKIYLCADASVVKLIELKTIVPADIVSVNILRLEPLSYVRVEENGLSLNPHHTASDTLCFHIALEPGEQSTFIAQSVGGKSVRTSIETILQGNPTLNNGLTEITNTGGYDRITITATDERQEFYLMISDTRNLKYFEMPGHVCGLFDISRLLHCAQLTYLHLKEGAVELTEACLNLKDLETLVVDNAGIDIDLAHFANAPLKCIDIRVGANTENLSFSIDALDSYDNKSYLESIFFRGESEHTLHGITGNLSSLSEFRNLRELVIPYTKITGDIGMLNNTKLERLIAAECELTGNISDLPGSCTLFSNNNGTGIGFRWPEVSRYKKKDNNGLAAKILSIPYSCKIDSRDINTLLVDQMQCNAIVNGKILLVTTNGTGELERDELYNCCEYLRRKGISDLKIDDEIFIEDGVTKIEP